MHTYRLCWHIFALRKIVLQNLEDRCVMLFSLHFLDTIIIIVTTIEQLTLTSITKHLTNFTQDLIHQMWPPSMEWNAIVLSTMHILSITVLNIKTLLAGECLYPFILFANLAQLFKTCLPKDRLQINTMLFGKQFLRKIKLSACSLVSVLALKSFKTYGV